MKKELTLCRAVEGKHGLYYYRTTAQRFSAIFIIRLWPSYYRELSSVVNAGRQDIQHLG
ncbi:MAG: hypothetical protein ACOX3R_01510 [Desulfitobacteriia bacterium]